MARESRRPGPPARPGRGSVGAPPDRPRRGSIGAPPARPGRGSVGAPPERPRRGSIGAPPRAWRTRRSRQGRHGQTTPKRADASGPSWSRITVRAKGRTESFEGCFGSRPLPPLAERPMGMLNTYDSIQPQTGRRRRRATGSGCGVARESNLTGCGVDRESDWRLMTWRAGSDGNRQRDVHSIRHEVWHEASGRQELRVWVLMAMATYMKQRCRTASNRKLATRSTLRLHSTSRTHRRN